MKFYTSCHQHKNLILLRGYEDGQRVQVKVPYCPSFFVEDKSKARTKWKTLYGKPLKRVKFNSIYEARDFIKKYEEIENFKLYGMTNFIYPFLNEEYPGEIQYDINLIRIGFIDIECKTENGFPDPQIADQEITAITLRFRKEIWAFGCGDFTPKESNVYYIKCKDEVELLHKFLAIWQKLDLDIISGWNTNTFDAPYSVNRINNVLGDTDVQKLSPWKIVQTRMQEILGREHELVDILGVAHLDYLELYKKFSYKPQESYKLNHIAHDELKEKKIDYSQYDDLLDLYKKNFQLFMEYNIQDVNLVYRIEEKMRLIELVIALAYSSKITFQDTFSSVKTWDVLIHNYLIEKDICIPFKKHVDKENQIAGAFVKNPEPKMYGWLCSFDAASLYPHIIMQHNISPETYLGKVPRISPDEVVAGGYQKYNEHLIENKCNITGAGTLFTNKVEGMLAVLTLKIYNQRVEYKNNMLEAERELEKIKTKDPNNKAEKQRLEFEISKFKNLQQAKKIVLNSLYGALSNPGLRWFNNDYAESITLTGQVIIKWCEKSLNELMNKELKTNDIDYVIAIDTDSCYLLINDWVNANYSSLPHQEIVDIIDKFCKEKVKTHLKHCFDRLQTYTNTLHNKIEMKREVIANKGIWTGKKHYILNMLDKEGVRYTAEPKLKMMGIEAVKSSTPQICRDKIKECLKLVMETNEETVQDFIAKFKNEFVKGDFGTVSCPKGVTEINKFTDKNTLYRKGTPMHVRGSILYNNLIKQLKLDKQYPLIGEGDKIKYCYLKMPNPIRENVICCPGYLPPQLGLDQYIDHETQFEKTFLSAMRSILDAANWSIVKQNNLSEFWS